VNDVLLDRLMEDLHVMVDPFAMCEVSTGSTLTIGQLGWVTLHFVLAGRGHVTLGRNTSPEIGKYTLILVKREHVLEGSGGDGAPLHGLTIQGAHRLVGTPPGPPDFIVACGRLQAVYGAGIDLFDTLADPIIVEFADSPAMRQLFELILAESMNQSDGSLGMIEALMRQCLVLLLRRLRDEDSGELAVLDGLTDPRMAAALTEVLEHPEALHTVESMAGAALMSRSAFSARFKEYFGTTPMSFVRRVRLRRSAKLLRTTPESVSTIARRTGYRSRSHFTRIFTDEYRMTPTEFRRREDPEWLPRELVVSDSASGSG